MVLIFIVAGLISNGLMTFEISNFINFPCNGLAIKLLIVNMVPFLLKLFTPNIPNVNSTLVKESNPYVEGN